MPNPRPILSVLVPTRNRREYVKHCIDNVLRVQSPDLELVILDNSDTNSLEQCFAEAGSNVKYEYCSDSLSMTENYARGWSVATGEYLTYIGDDDGVTPWLLPAARWAKANRVEALVPSLPAKYVWPDLIVKGSSAPVPGELRFQRFDGEVKEYDPLEELRACLRSGGQRFYGLPKLYYGIVQRSVLEQIFARAGDIFPGVSPDMAASVALATVVKSVHHVDFPVFVPGSSARSNAGISGRGQHVGRLRDQPHLRSDVERTWPLIVPRFYSVETIWAGAAVEALKNVGRPDLLPEVNVPLIWALCVMNHPRYVLPLLGSFCASVHASGRSVRHDLPKFAAELAALGYSRLRAEIGSALRSLGLRRPRSTNFERIQGNNIDEAVLRYATVLGRDEMLFDPRKQVSQ